MIELTPEQTEQIQKALAEGKKIEAIRICRLSTGMGLKESKEYVETLASELQAREPEKYAALSSAKGGCVSSIALMVTMGWCLFRIGESVL